MSDQSNIRPLPILAYRGHDRRTVLLVQIADQNVGTGFCQHLHGCFADARRTAGDHCRFAIQSHDYLAFPGTQVNCAMFGPRLMSAVPCLRD